jgi:hypothetical protein
MQSLTPQIFADESRSEFADRIIGKQTLPLMNADHADWKSEIGKQKSWPSAKMRTAKRQS